MTYFYKTDMPLSNGQEAFFTALHQTEYPDNKIAVLKINGYLWVKCAGAIPEELPEDFHCLEILTAEEFKYMRSQLPPTPPEGY